MEIFTEKPLNKAEELKLIENSPSREHLESELIKRNYRLVLKEAHRYKHVCDFNDLVQEGAKGLTIAATRFDTKLGNKFSTYSIWYIRKYILAWIGSEIKENNISDDGKTPTLSINREIYQSSGGGSKTCLQEFLKVESSYDSPSAKIEQSGIRDILLLGITSLSDEEQIIINCRLFTDEKKQTFSVLSKRLGYSISNIKAMETKALKKLNLVIRNHGITSLSDGIV